MMGDSDGLYRRLAAALRAAEERADTSERALASLRAELSQVVDVLIGRGGLAEGHRKLLARVAEVAAQEVPRRVRLRVLVDKYAMRGSDVDCASLMHLCKARCCSFAFELTTQDLDEGKVMWDVAEPYVNLRGDDGYCVHAEPATGGCNVYEHRPATCRGFDCREDKRIWLDFDQKIIAPA